MHIVIVTVYEDSEAIFQALRAGACGYLLKRRQPEKVIAAIQEAHEGGVPMTPEIARKVIGQFRGQATAAQSRSKAFPTANAKCWNWSCTATATRPSPTGWA